MSVENLKQFGKAVAENKEYQEKCKEIGIDDIDGLMAYAKELGYEFSNDDALALAKEEGITSEELSEDDLEKVAGGGIIPPLVGLVGMLVGTIRIPNPTKPVTLDVTLPNTPILVKL